jgi:hypothetical protein
MALHLKKLNFCDVTLRETIKTMKHWTTSPLILKQNKFKNILHRYNPTDIEIGSFNMPHNIDFDIMFRFSKNYINYNKLNTNLFVAIPTTKNSMDIAHNIGVKNISVVDNYRTNNKIINYICQNKLFESVKVYVSCSNICKHTCKPIPTNIIVDNICKYVFCKEITEVSIYNNYGSFHSDYMFELLYYLKLKGVPFSKLRIHFKRKIKSVPTNMYLIGGVCIANGIHNIDVSDIMNNGCPITIGDNNNYTNTQYNDIEGMYAASERILMSPEMLI